MGADDEVEASVIDAGVEVGSTAKEECVVDILDDVGVGFEDEEATTGTGAEGGDEEEAGVGEGGKLVTGAGATTDVCTEVEDVTEDDEDCGAWIWNFSDQSSLLASFI